MALALLALCAPAGQALETWIASGNENATINFSYSGLDDPYLDRTSPIEFAVSFPDASGPVPTNGTGHCFLNLTAPAASILVLNVSNETSRFEGNLTFEDATDGVAFTLACGDSANASLNHTFSNEDGPVTFEFDVLEPVIVDVYSGADFDPENFVAIAGGRTFLQVLARNITGTGTPVNIGGGSCNVSLGSATEAAVWNSSSGFHGVRPLPREAGNLSLSAACAVGQTIYNSTIRGLDVRPLLSPGGLDLGKTDIYRQPLILASHSSESFIVSAPLDGGVAATLRVTRLWPDASVLLDAEEEPWFGGTGLFPFDNGGGLSLIYAGRSPNSNNLFQSSADNFSTRSAIAALEDFARPALTVFDINSDGLSDVVVSGSQGLSNPTTRLLLNNGSGFEERATTLPDLQDASLCYGDFDGDSRFDLFASGHNGSEIVAGVYLYNGSDFALYQSLQQGLRKGTCALGRFLDENTTSLLHFGTTGSDADANWTYILYNDTRNWSETSSGFLPGFSGPIYGDAVAADFSGDGVSDLALCGGISGNASLHLFVNDLAESGEFVAVDAFNGTTALPECALGAADYDFDGDLDLAYTGVANGADIVLFNNSASLDLANTAPEPPAVVSGIWNQSTGELLLNWSSGGDNETPTGMLSYNLEIRGTDGDVLLSGQPAVSSKPFQGYLGNMQYRRNFTFQSGGAENVVVKIQTLDAGLRRSEWTDVVVLTEACQPSTNWTIANSGGCTLSQSLSDGSSVLVTNGSSLTLAASISLGSGTVVNISNGSLDVIGRSVGGNGSLISVGEDGSVEADRASLDGINLSMTSGFSVMGLVMEDGALSMGGVATLIDSHVDSFSSSAAATFVNTTWNGLQVAEPVDVRFHVDFNFTDQFGEPVTGVSAFNGSGSFNISSRINLTGFLANATANASRTHNLTFVRANHYNRSITLNLTDNVLLPLTLTRIPAPSNDGLDVAGLPAPTGDYKSDLAAYSAVENLTVSKTGTGSIRFLEPVNVSFANLSAVVLIQRNLIGVDARQADGLNVSANLTFLNISFQAAPVVLRNGTLCDSCSVTRFNGTEADIAVTGFSNYSLGNNSGLSLVSSSVLFNATPGNFSVNYHAYGNSSQAIAGASCSASGGRLSVALDDEGSPHTATLQFNATGTVNMMISCGGNSSFEPLNQTFELQVVRLGAYFLITEELTGLHSGFAVFANVSGQPRFLVSGAVDPSKSELASLSSPSGFSFDEAFMDGSAVVADLANDGMADLVALGETAEGLRFQWHDNFTSASSLGDGLEDGSVAVFDYDFDGDSDILACGANASGGATTVLLRNTLADFDYQLGADFEEVDLGFVNLRDCVIGIWRDSGSHWVALAGQDNAQAGAAHVYRVDSGSAVKTQTVGGWELPNLALLLHDLTGDGLPDLLLAGWNGAVYNTSFFAGNGSGFNYKPGLSSQLGQFGKWGTMATVGRMGNGSAQTLLLSGRTSGGLTVAAYGHNGSAFVEQDVAIDVQTANYGSLLPGDIDGDGDLDLLQSGQIGSSSITHIYSSSLSEFAGADTPPAPPNTVNARYAEGRLLLNWSSGNDSETPDELLGYSLAVGTASQPERFVSDLGGAFGNPPRPALGNLGHTLSANLSMPNACLSARLRSVDAAYQAGPWTDTILVNNRSEVCNGYDNDCDGQIDEDFLYPGTDLFIYNGSINGSSFVCGFYETYAPDRLSCPNQPTASPGSACRTGQYNGAVHAWNNATKTCDCDISQATLKNVQVGTGQNSGGGGFGAPSQAQPQREPEEEEPDEETPTENVQQSSGSTEQSQFSYAVDGFETFVEVSHANGRTYVSGEFKNTERTLKRHIRVLVRFPSGVLADSGDLKSLNRVGSGSNGDTVTFRLPDLDYLESGTVVYSLPGRVEMDALEAVEVWVEATNAHSAETVAMIEQERESAANESVTANVSEEVRGNRTVIRLDVGLKDNVSRANGVEIEQEIPKCLIEEITESVLESSIDPALLGHVEIKEADPLLVWRFDRIEDAVNLELSLEALRGADCQDEVRLRLLAKSFIYQNQPVDRLSVAVVLVLSVGLLCALLLPVALASRHRFHRHDNPHALRLAKVIVRRMHRGVSEQVIVRDLLRDDERLGDIHEALDHVREHGSGKTVHTLREHRVEIALFFAVLGLSLLELTGLLPGYLDWFKKVLSWGIMLLVVHHANLSRLFLNAEAPRLSLALMVGMFTMHLVRLPEFASEGLSESVGFVFDWYVLLVRLEHGIGLSWILFSAGMLVLACCACYSAARVPVRERSLGSLFFAPGLPQSNRRLIGRALGLLALFCVFFFSVFNRLIEWLAIAVDSALFVLAAIILLALSLSLVAHHRGHRARHLWERLLDALSERYLLILGLSLALLALLRPLLPSWLGSAFLGMVAVFLLATVVYVAVRLRSYHETEELERIPLALDHLYEKFIRLLRYPRTLPLALSGLLVLQLVVEAALYLVPNITGEPSHLYGAAGEETLLSLFGGAGLVPRQLFMLAPLDGLALGAMYLLSFLGLACLLLTPVWVWSLAFRNRGHGLASASVSRWLSASSGWTRRIGGFLIVCGPPLAALYIVHPVLSIEALVAEGSAGVVFIPRLLQVSTETAVIWIAGVAVIMLALGVLWRLRRIRRAFTYSSLFTLTGALVWIYLVPFIESLVLETLALFSAPVDAVHSVALGYFLGILQVADIAIIYVLGGACFLFIVLPSKGKQVIARLLRNTPVLSSVFEQAEETHLLEYYDEARELFSGNLVHHLMRFFKSCDVHGVPAEKQLALVKNHGYPPNLIYRALEHHRTDAE